MLYERDIKILEYTATPDGTIYDLMKWDNSSSRKICAPAGAGYMDSYSLLLQDRVLQFKDLCGYDSNTETISEEVYDNIQEIKDYITAFSAPRYHIIRTKTGDAHRITKMNFRKIFGSDDYNYLSYHGDGDIEDINATLSTEPDKHTFIFILEMLRCSKTIKKQYLGLVYERHKLTQNDAVIIQGLLGRCTGYDDNGETVIFTNIESIIKYEQLWSSNFDDRSIRWNSKTTKSKKGELIGDEAFNDPALYLGFTTPPSSSTSHKDIIMKKFNTVGGAITFYNQELKPIFHGQGPRGIYNINDEGFYTCRIRILIKVWS